MTHSTIVTIIITIMWVLTYTCYIVHVEIFGYQIPPVIERAWNACFPLRHLVSPALLKRQNFRCFETGSFYIALAVLELKMKTRLASKSQRSSCLGLPNAGIKGMSHHAQLCILKFKETTFYLMFLASSIFPKGMKGKRSVEISLWTTALSH